MANAAVFAAARVRSERQIISALRERSAFSKASAAPLGKTSMIGQQVLRRLIRRGVVAEASSGAYFLNEDAYDSMRSERRLRVVLVLLVALVVAVVCYVVGEAMT